ncbi:MAG: hypothetical protein ACRDOU_07685 [Streptosporangiaceae bacterium]
MTTEPSSQGLAQRSVGLRGDWIASITNVAPTAATTLTMAALIGASGLASPLALLVAGAAMLCCAVAYHRLNSWQASASAPVEWVARGPSPIIGFAVGILVLMTALTYGADLARGGDHASELVVVHHLPLPRRVDRADRGRGHRHVPARRLGFADLPG